MKRLAAIAALSVLGIAGVSAAVLVSSSEAAADDMTIFCSEFVPNAQAESNYAKWLSQNPGEKSRWEPFRDAICAGGNPTPPVMTTAKGRGLVAAGKMALPETSPPPTTTTTTTTTPTPPPSAASLYISPTGSDTNPGTQAAPVKTFNRAYQLAQCGSVVEVAAGTYGNQQINEVGALSTCASDVFFRPAASASVIVNNIDLGDVQGAQATNGPDHITLQDFKVPNSISSYGDSTFITLLRIDGGVFWIEGGRNWLVKDGDWGPCNSSGDSLCMAFFSKQIVIADAAATSDIVIEGNNIHDFALTASGDHYECIRMDGATNLTLRGNKFWNCQIYSSTTTDYRGLTLIENNWFNSCCGRASSLVMSDRGTGTILIRFNSFGPGQGVTDEGGRPALGVISAIGNIFGGTPSQVGGCHANINWQFNVWVAGGGVCGTGGVTVPALPYVNPAGSNNCQPFGGSCPASTADYHLAGTSLADNLVPASVANSGLATDIDGQVRATTRDAGSDEH